MSGKIDLKRIAGEVLDEMTVEDHDRRYHDGHYRGGPCRWREVFESADRLDGDLDAANEYEGKVYSGRRFEKENIERDFAKEFGIDQKKGMRGQFLEPDKDGNNQMEIVCRGDTPDSLVDEKKARDFFKKRGYDFKGMKVEEIESKGFNGKSRKAFRIDVYRPEKIEIAKGDKDDFGKVVSVGGGAISDDRASEMMKKYGVKREGGSFKRRTGDDNRRDRARKYLGIVGDWEGQSTREDAESGEWEKKRLASLKKAQEENARGDA